MSKKKPAQTTMVELVGPEPGSIEWWLAEERRAPLDDSDACDVRGDVLAELLRVYREQATRRAA